MADAKTTRTVLAAALCDATNGAGTWECLPPSGGREAWLHRADTVIRELARRERLIAKFDEVKDV